MKNAPKGMKLPRNLKIKKNEDGTFNIFMIKAKLTMPLKCLEKCKALTPSQFNYVKDYESRLAKDKEGKTLPCKALDRVKALLDKFTSVAPVARMLAIAEEMDRPVKTVDAIKSKLAELQANEYEDNT